MDEVLLVGEVYSSGLWFFQPRLQVIFFFSRKKKKKHNKTKIKQKTKKNKQTKNEKNKQKQDKKKNLSCYARILNGAPLNMQN